MTGLYEAAFRQVLYPAYESLRGRATMRYLRRYEADQWLAREAIEALQWRKLQALLAHCWANVAYYREQWRGLGIADPRDIRSRADYARLPLLSKAEIRANFTRLQADGWRGRLLYKTTGGSTGEPLRFGYTRESYERRMAVMHRGYGWAGARLGQRTLYLWGLPSVQTRKDRLYHRAFNRRMLDAFAMDDAALDRYADAFARFRPETVVSYVSPIVHLARRLLERGGAPPPPRRILTAAEALHPSQRALLERVFGCPVHDTYGCREFMLVAAQCTHGGMHLTADQLLVEFGQPIDGHDDGPRELAITDLHNLGMPLLRYLNGDLARPGRGACACGRGLPLLGAVDGRRLDALRTPDGRFVPGEQVVYALLGVRGVRRYQAVQRAPDRIELRIVRDHDFDPASLDEACAKLRHALGERTELALEYACDIPLTPAGKHRVTVNELAPP